MAYNIFETEQFLDDLRRLGQAALSRLEKKLHAYVYPKLRASPTFGPNVKHLRGDEPPTWRYRVGAWRFFFTIDEQDEVVLMIVAEDRGTAYRRR